MNELFLMQPLPAGACLGVIAPAGPPKPGVLEQVAPLIEQLGFRAKLFPGCAGPAQLGPLPYLAAADAQRLSDLHAAFADPEVDAVLCLRGGYGCIRLLDGLDLALLQCHPKPLIGYSDITSLHGALDRQGLPAWHAPMPASDWVKPGGMDDARRLAAQLQRGLRAGDVLAPEGLQAHTLSQGESAAGRLIGGNLSVLVSSLGTRWMPDARGAILFLEDIAEDPYRVDRYLAQLRLAGVLDAAAGFLIGSFSDAEAPDAVLADYLPQLGKPILAGWPSGHCCPNVALPLGVPVTLDVQGRALRF